MNGQQINIFQPVAPDDSKQNAYALYDYLYQSPEAAKAFYGAQEYGLGLRGIDVSEQQQNQNLARLASQDVMANYFANDVIRQSDSDFYKFYGQIVLSGASGGLAGGVPFLAAASAARGSSTVGTMLGYMLATRAGVGVTAGAVNATSQYLQDGTVRWTNVGVATAGGALGVGGGFAWNTAVGAAGGFMQTEVNNWLYNENKSVWANAITSGVAGGAGFLASDKTTTLLDGSYPKSLVPVLVGNTVGPVISEGVSSGLDSATKDNDSKGAK